MLWLPTAALLQLTVAFVAPVHFAPSRYHWYVYSAGTPGVEISTLNVACSPCQLVTLAG